MIAEYRISKKLIVYLGFLMTMGFFGLGPIEASSIKVQILPDEEGYLGGKKNDLVNLEQYTLPVSSSENISGDDKGLKGAVGKLPSKIGGESNNKQFGIQNDTFKDIKDLVATDTYTALLCKSLTVYLRRKGLDIIDNNPDLQIYVTILKIGPSCFSEYPPITEVVYKAMQDNKELFSGSFKQNYDCRFHLNPFYSAKGVKQIAVILAKDITSKLTKIGSAKCKNNNANNAKKTAPNKIF